MSSRMLPAWVITPVVWPVSLFLASAAWISRRSATSKSTSTLASLPSLSLMVTDFLPNGRTMNTLVMADPPAPSARIDCSAGPGNVNTHRAWRGRDRCLANFCWLADQPTVGVPPLRNGRQPLRMRRGIVAVVSRRDGKTRSLPGEQRPDQDCEHRVHDEAAGHSIEVAVAQLDALVVVSFAQTSVGSLTAFAIHTGLRARR